MSDDRANLPSASGAERLVNCARSWREEQAAIREGVVIAEQPATAEGTQIAKEIEDENPQHDIAKKLVEMEADVLAEFKQAVGAPDNAVLLPQREARLWVLNEGKAISSAKPDAYYLFIPSNAGLVLDDKSGFLDVAPAKENWQVRVQVIALGDEYPRLDSIRAGILHYRFHAKEDLVVFTRRAVEALKRDWITALHRAEDPLATYTPGDWCRYCKAATRCPAKQAVTVITPRWAVLTPQLKAKVWLMKSIINKGFDDLEAEFRAMTDEQLAVVGLKRKPNSPMPALADPQKVYNALQDAHIALPISEFMATTKVAKGGLVELLTERMMAGKAGVEAPKTKKAAKDIIETLLEPVTTHTPKKDSIVAI